MAVFQTVWPGWPPYCYAVSEYERVVVPSRHVMPCFRNMVVDKPGPKEIRKFLLERSVFDLVDYHKFLSLTDPKLLGWYLCLSPGDRTIIQDEGGFQQFLLRHPALELSRHHVYVKCNAGHVSSVAPAQPTVMSTRPTHVSQSTRSGATKCRSDLERLPNDVRETLNLLGCSKMQMSSSSSSAVCKEVSLLQSEWPTIEKGSSPGYHSFDSTQMDGTEYSDGSFLTLDPVEEEKNPEEEHQDHMASGSESTEGEDEASVSFGDNSDNFHSIMENDQSILVCLTSQGVKALNNGVHSGPVHADGETSQSVTERNAAETLSSLIPRVTTRDIAVGTELPPCTSTVTQTERPDTADKHVLTEVHMKDLDYLAEEFNKLKMGREKLQGQKEEMESSGDNLRKECDCMQRAQRAELRLLALQHSMCRQYCWRLYYTSSEGVMPENPSANITSVLQQLDSDYDRMRDEIHAGVPLEQLKPLSVDSETITTRATYIPAKIISDALGDVPSGSSQEPQKRDTSEGEHGCPADHSTHVSQLGQRKEKEIKKETSKARTAVTVVPQDKDATRNAHKPEGKQTTERQELNTCEAWFDAEENLLHAGPAVAAMMGQEPSETDETDASASEEVKSSVLCVSNLPSDVTESDVMLWFEKYHASEVSISALKNDLRVAIVMVSGPQSAEAAVRELRGCCMLGHALHVEHINRDAGERQRPASASIRGPETTKESTGPQTTKTGRKLMSQPLLSSSMKSRKVVSISPTAKGTFVPQHYGTMGSFDTLMTELSQRHPDAGRQRIVDALTELRVKHRGVLSGLPLRTIREMTSELLTRPTGATTL